MKKSLIFLSIFIVAFIAFWDAKDRLQELESVAVKTPAQVEMKPMVQKSGDRAEKDNIQKQNTQKQFDDSLQQNNNKNFKNPVNTTNKNQAPVNNQFR